MNDTGNLRPGKFALYNEDGTPSWSGASEGSVPTLVQELVAHEYERSRRNRDPWGDYEPEDEMRSELEEVENKQGELERAFGRFLEIAAVNGYLSAAELGYVLGFVNPEKTKFIEPDRRSGPIKEIEPGKTKCPKLK